MTSKKTNPASGQAERGESTNKNTRRNNSKIRKGTKLYNVVQYLASGKKIHRFQAERLLHDHVLPSTIAGLQREFNLPVARERITVRGYGGSKVVVAQYWLDPDAQRAARKLLEV
jgi:hypothetical protein